MADLEPYISIKMQGVNEDLPPHELPPTVWSSGLNIRFKNNAAEQVKGYDSAFGTLLISPNWLLSVPDYPTYFWIYASTTSIRVTDMTTHYDITPVAGVTGDLDVNWNGGLLHGIAVMNNGFDEPIWWDGSTSSPMTTLPAWPASARAQVLKPYKNYLVAMNYEDSSVGNNPDMVKWSDAADPGSVPGSWDETDPTTESGLTTLSDTPGRITAGEQLGEMFVIYKADSCYTMQYVGGRFVFSFKKALDTVGAINADSVATVGNRHVVLGFGDIVIHDTISSQSIINERMRTWLFNQINPEYLHRSFVVPYHRRDEIWFCFPSGGATLADTVLVWNYKDDEFSVRTAPLVRYMATGFVSGAEVDTWDADSEVWDADQLAWNEKEYSRLKDTVLAAGTTVTNLYEMDATDLNNGEDIQSYLERISMPLLSLDRVKTVKAVWPKMDGEPGTVVSFRIGTQMSVNSAVDWSPKLDFTIGQDEKLDLILKGRYISVRVEASGQTSFRLQSLELEIEETERY